MCSSLACSASGHNWPAISFDAIKLLATLFYPDLNSLLDAMANSLGFMEGSEQAASNAQGLTSSILGTLYNFTFGSLMMLVGMAVVFICWGLVLVNLAGSLTVLAMNLVLGPVFFALAFDRDFRGHAQKWLAALLSYILLIPLYGAALNIAAAIAGAAVPTRLFGMPSGSQVMAQIIGPILSVGVVFSTNKVINALVGGAVGSGAGSLVVGIAGIGMSLIPGGALMRSTAAATRAAGGAAAGAAKSWGPSSAPQPALRLGNRRNCVTSRR